MSDTDNDDRSTVSDSKPHFDPRAVCRIAKSIPNCSLVTSPRDHIQTSTYFSQFSRHLQKTFSKEENHTDEEDDPRKNEVLSFLVSDSFSVEQLAAEADGFQHSSMLDGAGIARVDVYCQSGTVCTCRVIQTGSSSDDQLMSHGSVSTPRAGNTTGDFFPSPITITLGNMQIRRVIRLKCSLDSLRRILERPPKLVEINESIIDSPREEDDDIDSHAPSVSKLLRTRKEKRSKEFSLLCPKKQAFMDEQRKKYNNRLRHEEKVRQHVASAILAGGEEGVDLSAIRSLSMNDMDNSSQASDTTDANESGNVRLPLSEPCNPQQKIIQDKIEIADMGLAILMAEAQRLDRILLSMKEEEDLKNKTKEGDFDTGSTSKQTSLVGSNEDTDRSVSTDSRSGSQSIDSYLRHIKQGCEVEYSFPHEYHDELEGALLGEDVGHGDDSSSPEEDSDEESREAFASLTTGRRRGRSPPRDTGKRDAMEPLSPIVAIPTNGKGCVVMRGNGAFDVVGEIPEKVYKKLFKEKAFPVQISVGTLGRYYVLFDDGSFFFCGDPSLSKLLIREGKKIQRKPRNKGKQNLVSIASVAFGKELDDYFIVRSDGSWESHGVLPLGLEELMRDRNYRSDLLWAALGVNGEWCVKSKKGRVWWGNVSDEADEVLSEVTAEDSEREVQYIDFGTGDTYFILHVQIL